MMATATVAAGAGVEVAFHGDAAQLKSLGDVLGDGLLQFLHFLLGIEVIAGDRVFQEGVARLFEISDLTSVQRKAGLLFLLEQLSFDHEGVVLAAGLVISHESLDFLPQRADLGLIQDGLAEFPGFLGDNRVFSLGLHNC